VGRGQFMREERIVLIQYNAMLNLFLSLLCISHQLHGLSIWSFTVICYINWRSTYFLPSFLTYLLIYLILTIASVIAYMDKPASALVITLADAAVEY